MKKSFHAAKLDSPRLKRLLDFLRGRGTAGATSLELSLNCQTVCASTGIAELRANGCDIQTVRERKTQAGPPVFRYVLLESFSK